MNWLIYAFLSAITAALVAIFGKVGLEGVDSVVATGIRAGIMFGIIFIVLALTGKLSQVLSINRNSLLYIGLGGLAGAASWVFYFLALQSGKASLVAPIDRLSVAFVIVLSAIFLGEQITLQTAVGVLLIVVGAIIIILT